MYRILLVEDEDIIRKGLMFMMDWGKVNCVIVGEAADGEEGLARIQEFKPDIVIVDVKMPIKNGLQMLEESIDEYGYEAIIVSGYSEFEYAKTAISLGVTDYLLKPIDFNQLTIAIEKIIQKLESNSKLKGLLKQEHEKESLLSQPLLSSQHAKSRYAQYMLDYIQQEYFHRISLTDLSEKYNISCTHLNSKFKAETGYTFNDYLNRYRILKAVELLRRDDLKVYEIAEQVGFLDYKYFIKVFKKYVGCSPIKFLSANGSADSD